MAFLAFEGLDGSGKSTLMTGLALELSRRGVASISTREPGGTLLSEKIRSLLLGVDDEIPHPRTELLLYQASRAQHVEMKIRPALEKNQWVFCDRFTASSVAFQAGARGLGRGEVDWLNDYATDLLRPDLNILIDVPVAESLLRLEQRTAATTQAKDRMESEPLDFHERVRRAYVNLAKENPLNWLVLNGHRSPEELLNETLNCLVSREWLA